MTTVLVTGASGFVGRHLVPRLRARGIRVLILARGGSASGADVVAGPADLSRIDSLADWPPGVAAVIHLAASNPKRGNAAGHDLDALRHANVAATAAIARRAGREGVPRMILVSSASVHAPAGETPIDETDRPDPSTPYARSKLEAETAFWNAIEGTGTTGVVLRPAPIFGPGAANLTGALARLARLPLPLPLEGLGAARSLVSVDAVVEAIGLSLTCDAAGGQTMLLAQDAPLRPSEIVAALRRGRRLRRAILPAPVGLLERAAGWANRKAAFDAARQGLVIDASLARQTLNWQPGTAADALRIMAGERRL